MLVAIFSCKYFVSHSNIYAFPALKWGFERDTGTMREKAIDTDAINIKMQYNQRFERSICMIFQ